MKGKIKKILKPINITSVNEIIDITVTDANNTVIELENGNIILFANSYMYYSFIVDPELVLSLDEKTNEIDINYDILKMDYWQDSDDVNYDVSPLDPNKKIIEAEKYLYCNDNLYIMITE